MNHTGEARGAIATGEFAGCFASRSNAMRWTAYLLCGDWHRAEDLVRTAFVKLYRASRIAGRDTLDAYTRQIVVRTFLDETDAVFFHREQPTAEHSDQSVPEAGSVEDQPWPDWPPPLASTPSRTTCPKGRETVLP